MKATIKPNGTSNINIYPDHTDVVIGVNAGTRPLSEAWAHTIVGAMTLAEERKTSSTPDEFHALRDAMLILDVRITGPGGRWMTLEGETEWVVREKLPHAKSATELVRTKVFKSALMALQD